MSLISGDVRRILIPALVVALLFGLAASVAVADSDSRPFKGSDAFTWSVECDFPAGFCDLEFEGEISATHLGKGTVEGGWRSDVTAFDPFTNPCWPNDGTTTLVAANGDELHASLSGEICVDVFVSPNVFENHFTLEVDGGTGRFDDATGTISLTGTGLGDPFRTHASVYEGTISY